MQSNHNVEISHNVINNKIWRELTSLFIDSNTNIEEILTLLTILL